MADAVAYIWGWYFDIASGYGGANDTLYPYDLSYMRYINVFLPAAVFSNYIAIFVRADNDPNRAMIGVLSGGVVNIVLDIMC